MKNGFSFKARIKVGTVIGQDLRVLKWPACFWTNELGRPDPDMTFDCTSMDDGQYDCRAVGFGKKPVYGNGSLYVCGIDGLVVASGEDRDTIVRDLRARKLEQVEAAEATAAKLRAELGSIS